MICRTPGGPDSPWSYRTLRGDPGPVLRCLDYPVLPADEGGLVPTLRSWRLVVTVAAGEIAKG